MQVKLHKPQYEVVSHPARFKVVTAGRRWGKSVLARMWILQKAMEVRGTYWVVSPTFSMGKDIHWKQGFLNEIPGKYVSKINQAELEIILYNGSRIALKSAEHPDRLRGVKLNALVVDEIASIRNWDWLWMEVLRPTLTDYRAPALFISTPAGFNHFYQLYLKGMENSEIYDPNYKSWQWTSYDNKYIPKDEIDAAKKELPEDTFAQEYMADFRKMSGLIFKGFDRKDHVIKPFDIPRNWRRYRAMDFGSTNPTVCLWIAVDHDENFYIYDEYYESEKTVDYHSGVIVSKTGTQKISGTYGDPSAAQWITEFGQRGVYVTRANKEKGTATGKWVILGINKIQEKLKVQPGRFVDVVGLDGREGYPSFFVFNSCTHTINEFETYRWKMNNPNADQDLNEPDTPEKANDHAMDSFRYFIVSYKKNPSGVAPKQWSDKQWQIGK